MCKKRWRKAAKESSSNKEVKKRRVKAIDTFRGYVMIMQKNAQL